MAEAATAPRTTPSPQSTQPHPGLGVETDLDGLAKEMGRFASGLSSLGELIRGSSEMQSSDWNLLYSGVGDLVELLGDYANDLAERGFTIDRNLKAMGEQCHG